MTKSKIVLVSISILILIVRVGWGRAPTSAKGERVRLVIPTIDYPEYRDFTTVIRRGKWEVSLLGYTKFMPGEIVEVEGVIGDYGRVVEGKLLSRKEDTLVGVDAVLVWIARVRHGAVERLQRWLPEPHASLAIGILLGVKRSMPATFYDSLVETGTLHIVAASGYNVAVLSGVVVSLLSRVLPRHFAIGVSTFAILGYVLLAGGSASIVRAGIMGSLSLIGVILGRPREAKWLLMVAAWLMVVVSPEMIMDVGFQLSVAATLGILYLSPVMDQWQSRRLQAPRYMTLVGYSREYLYPTLGATLATAPVIYWHFGRVSLIGIVVNLLILPVVPLIMLLATLTLAIPWLSSVLYVPLWWVVSVIRWFG